VCVFFFFLLFLLDVISQKTVFFFHNKSDIQISRSQNKSNHVFLRSVPFRLRHIFCCAPSDSQILRREGHLKNFKTVCPFLFPLSLLNVICFIFFKALLEPPSLRQSTILGAPPTDLLPRRRRGRGLVDAGAAPIDVEVKVRRRRRAFDLGQIVALSIRGGLDLWRRRI